MNHKPSLSFCFCLILSHASMRPFFSPFSQVPNPHLNWLRPELTPHSICGMAVDSKETINRQMDLDTVNMDERHESRGEFILSKDLGLTLGTITNSYRFYKQVANCYRSILRMM